MALGYRLYSGAQLLLVTAAVFGAALLFSGWGTVLFPASGLASQRLLAGSLALGVGLGGWYVFGRLRIGRWHAVGQRAGLTPDGSAGLGSRIRTILTGPVSVGPLPDLTGSIMGQPVRAKTYAASRQGTDTGARSYTVVEAELTEPSDVGLLLLPATGEGGATVDRLPGDLETAAVDDEVVMVGSGSGAYAEQVLSERGRSALLDVTDPVGLFVGDPTDAMLDAMGGEAALAASFLGDELAAELRGHPANDADTVSTNHRGLLLDPADLERQAAAVAAVATEVERVRHEATER